MPPPLIIFFVFYNKIREMCNGGDRRLYYFCCDKRNLW